MIVCASLQARDPDDAAFCMACPTRLAPSALAREQRKTVTIVFMAAKPIRSDPHEPF